MFDCIFCKMINKEMKAKIEFENDEMFVIHDINAQAPVHVLIIPKRHIEKIADAQSGDGDMLGKAVLCAKDVAKKNNWADYRLIFNNGATAGQSVFHIHLHLLSGRPMTWPPG